MKIPFHTSSCREGYGCALECEVRWLLEENKMSDKQTLSDMVEDLQIEMIALRAELQHWKNIAFKLYSPWTHMEGVEMMKAKIEND
jgi:predicted molibdopterin-dependent oxidoreductase YjgC